MLLAKSSEENLRDQRDQQNRINMQLLKEGRILNLHVRAEKINRVRWSDDS